MNVLIFFSLQCTFLVQWRNGVPVDNAMPGAIQKWMPAAVINLFVKRWMRIWHNSSTFDACWRLRTYRICWSQPHCGYTFKTIAVIMVRPCCYNVDMLAKTVEFFYQYMQMNCIQTLWKMLHTSCLVHLRCSALTIWCKKSEDTSCLLKLSSVTALV